MAAAAGASGGHNAPNAEEKPSAAHLGKRAGAGQHESWRSAASIVEHGKTWEKQSMAGLEQLEMMRSCAGRARRQSAP
jgi:hypothetical protein